jgi:hypothetical protein
MGNYKILENRTELTEDQIAAGMDFEKIAGGNSTKSLWFKKIILSCLIGISIVGLGIWAYFFLFPVGKKNIPVQISNNNYQPVKNRIVKRVEEKKNGKKHEGTPLGARVKKADAPTSKNVSLPLEIASPTVEPLIGPSSSPVFFKGQQKKSYAPAETEDLYNENELHKHNLTSKNKQNSYINIKEINRSIAKINDSLYASKYEVSNKQYTVFLNALKAQNNLEALTVARIDTLKWNMEKTYMHPYVTHYHSHVAYQNYPLVNVSREAAILFCEWLTDQYNSHQKRKFKKVLFRLPYEKECF